MAEVTNGSAAEEAPAVEPVAEEEPQVEYVCPPEFNESEKMRKMYVGNIPAAVTEEEFKALFQQYGNVAEAVVIKKGESGAFGFIIFQTCDEVDECLKKRPISLKERELQIKRAIPKEADPQTAHLKTNKIFIGNVVEGVTEANIKSFLLKRHGKYIKINSVSINRKKKEDGTLEPKGFAFVEVENEDMADRIVTGDPKAQIAGEDGKTLQNLKKAFSKGAGGAGRGGRGGGRGFHGQQYGRGGFAYGGGYGGYGGYGAYGGGYGAGYGYGGYPAYGGWGGYGYGGW